MKRIAIQGVPGSYHDIAAHKYFKDEDIELICCNTFEDVFGEMKRDDNVCRTLWHENPARGNRDKQTQFHPLSRGMRPMDSR